MLNRPFPSVMHPATDAESELLLSNTAALDSRLYSSHTVPLTTYGSDCAQTLIVHIKRNRIKDKLLIRNILSFSIQKMYAKIPIYAL